MIIRRRCHCRIRLSFMSRTSYPLCFLRMHIQTGKSNNRERQTEWVRCIPPYAFVNLCCPFGNFRSQQLTILGTLDTSGTFATRRERLPIIDSLEQNETKTKQNAKQQLNDYSVIVCSLDRVSGHIRSFDYSFSHLFDSYLIWDGNWFLHFFFRSPQIWYDTTHKSDTFIIFVGVYIIAFDAFLAK